MMLVIPGSISSRYVPITGSARLIIDLPSSYIILDWSAKDKRCVGVSSSTSFLVIDDDLPGAADP